MKDNNFNFNQIFLNTLDSRASEQLLSFLHLNNISANISEKSLSILLAKASFAFLLISMFSYWFQLSFKSEMLMKFASYLPSIHFIPRFAKGLAYPYPEGVKGIQKSEMIPHTPLPLQRFASIGYRGKKLLFLYPYRGMPLQGKMNVIPLWGKELYPSNASLVRTQYPFTPLGYWVRGIPLHRYEQLKTEGLSVNVINKERKVIDRKNFLKKVPLVSMWSANITLAFLLSIRWIESGHFPLSNLYESLIFLSWSLTVIHLYLENLFHKREQILYSETAEYPLPFKGIGFDASYPRGVLHTFHPARVRTLASITNEACTARQDPPNVSLVRGLQSRASTLTLGAITSPVALFTNAFATFSLPHEMQKVTVLVPALKSNWLIMHVSVMIISYAALLSGSLLAMAFLGIQYIDDNKISFIMSPFMVLLQVINAVRKLSSRLLAKGFVFLQSSKALALQAHTPLPLWGIGESTRYTPFNASLVRRAYPVRGKETEGVLVNPSVSSWQKKERLAERGTFFTSRFADGYNFASNELATFRSSTSSKRKWLFQKSHDSKNESDSKLIIPNILSRRTETPSINIKNQLNYFTYANRASDWKNKLYLTPSEPLLLNGSIKENQVLMGSLYPIPEGSEVLDLPQILDNLSYRSIGLGFALLTIGILSGAVWANEAWGSYWSWDPKETWAFITWLVFALYLHTRLSKGWVGKESAFVASFGFIVIWFCYLGVNLFGKGLHSYGWFQQ